MLQQNSEKWIGHKTNSINSNEVCLKELDMGETKTWRMLWCLPLQNSTDFLLGP